MHLACSVSRECFGCSIGFDFDPDTLEKTVAIRFGTTTLGQFQSCNSSATIAPTARIESRSSVAIGYSRNHRGNSERDHSGLHDIFSVLSRER